MMNYSWNRVNPFTGENLHSSTTRKEAEDWWNKNHSKLGKGTYQLTEWSGLTGNILREVKIN
jgi:hypothetical protein